MADLMLDTDPSGHSFAFDEQRRTFHFNHRLPESILATLVGAPLASVVECAGDYEAYSESIIVSATSEDGWLAICIHQAD